MSLPHNATGRRSMLLLVWRHFLAARGATKHCNLSSCCRRISIIMPHRSPYSLCTPSIRAYITPALRRIHRQAGCNSGLYQCDSFSSKLHILPVALRRLFVRLPMSGVRSTMKSFAKLKLRRMLTVRSHVTIEVISMSKVQM